MGKEDKENVHSGHRERMRQRVLANGLVGLSDHEVLEVLLYTALPRRDTNRLAHSLLRGFGSLNGVLNASLQDLQEIAGIGPKAAFAIIFHSLVAQRCWERQGISGKVFGSFAMLEKYVVSLFAAEKQEAAYLLAFNNSMRLINSVRLAGGSLTKVNVPLNNLVRHATRLGAVRVVLAHNHPSGNPKPSSDDIDLTELCQQVLTPLNIELVDHCIVYGHKCFSMKNNHYFEIIKSRRQQRELITQQGIGAEPTPRE